MAKKQKFEIHTKKSISVNLKDFCIFAICREDGDVDSMEITEWKNQEGFDVYMSAGTEQTYFSLTRGQYDALKALVKKLEL